MKGKEIREKFLKYFEQHGHTRLPSSSLVPEDPSVLLTLAGMLQFKPIFLGKQSSKYRQVTTVQKCIRMNDIENVGRTPRHHTFFEMLGNFSFGSYFKKEAMAWALELLTRVFNLPLERLYFAVFEDDREAFDLWGKTFAVHPEKIVRLGADNNFWSVGPTGPCGPCSEIYYDLGPTVGCQKPTCAPGCDCSRYLELWNLVFIEFNRDEAGKLHSLPAKNIDTGMGLERITAVLQEVPTNFDTDLIKPIIEETEKLCGGLGQAMSFRVIADHMRAVTHLIADGVIPGNEGRGYVLRRIIRRAVRYGKVLGINEPFLSRLSKVVVNIGKEAYPELGTRADYIGKVLTLEEQTFLETLNRGIGAFRDLVISYRDQGVLPGAEVFKLHDTYGFPFELSAEMAQEEGLKIDKTGFDRLMEEQRQRARGGGLTSDPLKSQIQFLDLAKLKPTKFVGYQKIEEEVRIVKIFPTEKVLVLDKTPFYPESGGQVADSGLLIRKEREILVQGVYGRTDAPILHQLETVDGLKEGDRVLVKIDASKRAAVASHHTATHLLHAALRHFFGEGVKQAGSLVAPDRLRFDFNYTEALTRQQLDEIENFVNEAVNRKINVEVFEKSLEEARALGAMALFNEKYGKKVRVVSVPGVSLELCGGTHVGNTQEIGFFRIVSEAAIAAGVRRIEAVAGRAAKIYIMLAGKKLKDRVFELVREYKILQVEKARLGMPKLLETGIFEIEREELDNLGHAVDQVDPAAVRKFIEHLRGRVEWLEDRNENVRKELSRKKVESALAMVPKLVAAAVDLSGVKVVVHEFEGFDMDTLRQFADKIKVALPNAVVVLASVSGQRVMLLSTLAADLVAKGLNAVDLVNAAAAVCGGKGGGRKDKAEAGGKDPSKIKAALEAAFNYVKGKLS